MCDNAWIAAIQNGRWVWGLGDPSLGAVLVTALYLLCALACGWTARLFRCSDERPNCSEYRFWLGLAVLLLLLGINKQADLQTWLTLWGRDLLRHLGLYGIRRSLQFGFILLVIVCVATGILCTARFTRRLPAPCWWATAGLALQAAFVVMRAASFHHADRLLGIQLLDVKLNLVFESLGLCLILAASVARWRSDQ